MSDVPPDYSTLQELIGYTDDGERIFKVVDLLKLPHNKKMQQRICVHIMVNMLGDDAFLYAEDAEQQARSWKMKDALIAVRQYPRARDVGDGTLRKWLKHYVTYGFTPAEMEDYKKRYRVRSTDSTTFDQGDDRALLELIDSYPQLYLDEIQREMLIRRKRMWSPSTLWRRLKHHGFSLQKAAFRARQMSEEEQSAYHVRMVQNVYAAEQVVFIDEAARGINDARRDRAWGIRGRQPILDTYFDANNIRTRYTFLAAADCNGFIMEACDVVERERNSSDPDLTRGTVDTARFEAWVEFRLVPVLGNYALGEPRSIVVMDNAIIHLSDRVQELIHGAGALLLFTAPYSPHLNPIEYMFAIYKAYLRRIGSSMDWLTAHWEAMAAITPEFARNEFRHCNVPGWERLFETDPITTLANELGTSRRIVLLIFAVLLSNSTPST